MANTSDLIIPSNLLPPFCNSADIPIVALSGHRELELTTEFHEYGEMSKELKV